MNYWFVCAIRKTARRVSSFKGSDVLHDSMYPEVNETETGTK